MKAVNPQSYITVFYDGACGLCAREINYYRSIAPDNVFVWVNLIEDTRWFEQLGYSQSQGLQALHVLDEAGRMHVGVEAFIVIWNALPGWRVLSILASLPVVKPLLSIIYRYFAQWRFKKLGYSH